MKKAYIVTDKYGEAGYSTVIFAETRGKAVCFACATEEFEDYSFTELRANRCKEMDKFYNGRNMMDWYNPDDRVAMVRYAFFQCSYELSTGELECGDCPAKQWCIRYEDYERLREDNQ